MEEPYKKKEKQQAACMLCTLLLVGLLILLLVLYFAVLKPKDPRVQVPAMQLLSYATTQGGDALSLSLSLQVSMYNPNRADFVIQDGSTACLYYQGQQVGFTLIPAGIIPSQTLSIAYVSLSTSSASIQLVSSTSNYDTTASALQLPVSTSITIIGHVTTANLFSHHSDVVSKCQLQLLLSKSRAFIQSYTCQRSYSLDD